MHRAWGRSTLAHIDGLATLAGVIVFDDRIALASGLAAAASLVTIAPRAPRRETAVDRFFISDVVDVPVRRFGNKWCWCVIEIDAEALRGGAEDARATSGHKMVRLADN